MSMEIFFLKSFCWKEKTFSGDDLLVDIPVLTQFLCEAFKQSWKYGQTSQARHFFLLWRVQFPVWRPSVPGNTWLSALSWPHPEANDAVTPAHKSLSLHSLWHRATLSITWWKKMYFPWNFSSNFWLLLSRLAASNPVYCWKTQLLNADLSA